MAPMGPGLRRESEDGRILGKNRMNLRPSLPYFTTPRSRSAAISAAE
jgi:hypothetical protein